MATYANSFTAVGNGTTVLVKYLDEVTFSVSGTFVGTVVLEKSDSLLAWERIASYSAATSGSFKNEARNQGNIWIRFRCTARSSGTIVASITDVSVNTQEFYDSKGVLRLAITDQGVKAIGVLEAEGPIDGFFESDVASATSVNFDAVNGNTCRITGTATITSITLAEGRWMWVRFNSACTLQHGASLVLPGGANIVCASQDTALFIGFPSSVVRCLFYTRASGDPVNATITAAAKTVLDDATVAAMRTTLGTAEDPGAEAVNVLRIAANVAETETVTIGADVYEVEVVNTDSTDNTADSDWANTTDPLTVEVDSTTYPNLAGTLAVGDLIRIENEIMRVSVVDGDNVTFLRGQSGTTAASHADANDIYVGDGIAGGSTIAVGVVATLTPAVFSAAIVDDINGVGTEAVTAVKVSDNEVLIYADAVGATTTACSETLAGANNEWSAAAMYGGRAQAQRRYAIQKRVPTATEVALGNLHLRFDFTPTAVQVFVAPTATPGALAIWDGAVAISGGLVTLDNSGATDWATTDDVTVIAWA